MEEIFREAVIGMAAGRRYAVIPTPTAAVNGYTCCLKQTYLPLLNEVASFLYPCLIFLNPYVFTVEPHRYYSCFYHSNVDFEITFAQQ